MAPITNSNEKGTFLNQKFINESPFLSCADRYEFKIKRTKLSRIFNEFFEVGEYKLRLKINGKLVKIVKEENF